MQRVVVTDDFIIVSDGNTQTLIKIDEESQAYQDIKTNTKNFTENMDFPKTELEILRETVDRLVLDSLGV